MNLSTLRIQIITLLFGALLLMSGCGGSSGGIATVLSPTASNDCVACHATNSRSVSTTSGVKITEQWLLSAHNTAKGAGCMDCHSNAHFHDNVTSCRSCHATAHSNNGTSCNLCHGGGSKEVANCSSCHLNVHSIANMNKDSCTRCHGGAIPVDVAMKNPDFAGKCFGCHNGGRNFRRYTAVTVKHFNNITGNGVHPAKYVTVNYQNSCTSCHEPHNPLKGQGSEQRKAWAKSMHGDVNGVAWSNRDFKNYFDTSTSSYACIRCHTATGFINFAASNPANPLPATTWAASGDTGREVLSCKACHTSSNFKNSVRQLPPFTAPYGASGSVIYAPLAFPDVGESNLCIPCHSGRENGVSIKKTISDFSNASFKNPHYLAAAAVFYGVGGFQFYSSNSQTAYWPQAYTSKYGVVVDGTIIKAAAASSTVGGTPAINIGDSLTGKKAPWSHGKLGMDNFITSAPTTSGNILDAGNKGQCIACHLGSKGDHSFGAFNVARSTWGATLTAANGCYGCHSNEDMEEVAAGERLLVDRAMAFFKWQLLQAGTEYTSKHPYFYQPGTTNATKDWTALTVTNGKGSVNMGAALNFELLTAEKGIHVHNRTFMKQLIFDSIQYLQSGKVTFSNRYIATNAQSDPNNLLLFSNYSTHLTANPDNIINNVDSAAPPRTPVPGAGNGVVGQPVSISQLKRYLTRYNTSAPTTGTFTRP